MKENNYDGQKIIKKCQDGKGNSLWFNPKGFQGEHKDDTESFCKQLRVRKYKGYDKSFGIDRTTHKCVTVRQSGGNINRDNNQYTDMTTEQSSKND